jgi:hypothetical protein
MSKNIQGVEIYLLLLVSVITSVDWSNLGLLIVSVLLIMIILVGLHVQK